jgi:predicted 2-oxoglutarate/Fe(II)-dependent dioxygenase YbiX
MRVTKLTDTIFTIEDFLTRQECLDTIVKSEGIGYELAKVNTASGAKVRTDIRNNSRAFYKSEELAQQLWEKLQPLLPPLLAHMAGSTAIGLNELFRFYRYQRGHQFKGHYDERYVRSEHEVSELTLMEYLNDNFQGGDTTFRGVSIQPRQGMALLFLHSLYHEGSEVTQGVKYVLRSDVMYCTETPA